MFKRVIYNIMMVLFLMVTVNMFNNDIKVCKLQIVEKHDNINMVNIDGDIYGFYSDNDNDLQIGDTVEITFDNGEITNYR